MVNYYPTINRKFNNRGGGRKGYTYERDQLIKLRQLVDRMLSKIEGIEKGKIKSETEFKKFQLILPVFLKAMDKLHADKKHLDLEGEVRVSTLIEVIKYGLADAAGNQTISNKDMERAGMVHGNNPQTPALGEGKTDSSVSSG